MDNSTKISHKKIITIVICFVLMMIIVALSQIIPMIQYDIKYKDAESKKINYYIEENAQIHYKPKFYYGNGMIIRDYELYSSELEYHPEIKKELDKNIDEKYFKQGNSILVVEDRASSKDGIEGIIYEVKLNGNHANVMISRKNRVNTDYYDQYTRLYFIPINENNIRNLTYQYETPPHFSTWAMILEIAIFVIMIVFLISETKIKKENKKWFIKNIIAGIGMICISLLFFGLVYVGIIFIIMIIVLIIGIKVKKESINSVISRIIKIIGTIFIVSILYACFMAMTTPTFDKPIIYLYPEEETKISIQLGFPNKLTTTYPKYNNSWNVTAYPDGTLIDSNGRIYYCLYWEGKNIDELSIEEGFCVKREDTAKFLEEKLSVLGLTEKEANEFIIYWLPRLEKNNYNLIEFETIEEINKSMPLKITPNPDTIIRIMMKFKGVNKYTKINEQQLSNVERKGFTVVEWGGTELH